MEIAKIILDFITALLWPSVVLTVIFLFKKQLVNVLDHIRKADLLGGVSLEFNERVEKATKLSKEIAASPKLKNIKKKGFLPRNDANMMLAKLGLQPSLSGLDTSYYKQLAENDPNLALAGVRIELEQMVKNLAIIYEIDMPNISTFQLHRKLKEAGVIGEGLYDLATQILSLANKAVLGEKVSTVQAVNLISSTEVLFDNYLLSLSRRKE